jgi:hypothetical protein
MQLMQLTAYFQIKCHNYEPPVKASYAVSAQIGGKARFGKHIEKLLKCLIQLQIPSSKLQQMKN